MSYVIFKAKFGLIERDFYISRVSYNIEDTFKEESENGNVSHYKKITVKGKMKKSEIKSYNIAYTQTSGRISGNCDLYFSDTENIEDYYLKIKSVSIINIQETGDTWTEWGDIEAVFSDETGNEENSGLLTFKGTGGNTIRLYNSNIEIYPSKIRRNYSSVRDYSGSFVQENGFDFINIRISGEIPYDSCLFPEEIIDIIEAYEQREGVDNEYYPICENLTYFLPSIKTDVKHAFVTSSQMVWSIEKKQINVNIELTAPNQKIGNVKFDKETEDNSDGDNDSENSDSDFILRNVV